MVQAWSPEFDPLRDDIVTTPVWVRLSNLPVNFYHKAILMGIAKGLGQPIKVDLTTLHVERARLARVCVEVNLKKPLKGTVKINGERYFVAYEGMTNICAGCGMYGHLIHGCPRVVSEKERSASLVAVATEPIGVPQGADGFTPVRRSGRRPKQTGRRVVFSAGGTRENLGRNLRHITGSSDYGKIVIGNSFGSLEEDTPALESMEGFRRVEENKENTIYLNQHRKGKSMNQGKEGNIFKGLTKGNGLARDGPSEKGTGRIKGT